MALPESASLADMLRRHITEQGPIGVDDYMGMCLGGAGSNFGTTGYYHSRDPFGATGDFTTAPEISGLFGEMCGLYLSHMYEVANAPDTGSVIELGPGRGTLMRDMRGVWERLMPGLAAAALHLVETSPSLRRAQDAMLGAKTVAGWHDDVESALAASDGPLFGIANEFFDALPAAQLVFVDGAWHRRMVGLRDGHLGFVTGAVADDIDPDLPEAPADGMVAELCLQASHIVSLLGRALARRGGAMLIVDYGRQGNPGDSLQAVANHHPVDLFAAPGDSDISHWVDFAALGRAAQNAGARLVGPAPQGRFLMRIGLAARAEQAARHAAPEERRTLLAAIDRLTSPAQMGEVFKVALLLPPGAGLPPGFESDEA
jgi:NADH dehydrogenase [ubiquinone] 1 alpha subcomplex assembly factor 7